MKIVKRVNKNDTYQAKNGKEYPSINYYVVLDNGTWVSIRASFSKDYTKLDAVCETIVNG